MHRDVMGDVTFGGLKIARQSSLWIVTLLMTPPAALLKVFYPTDIFLLLIIFRIKPRHVTT